MTPLNPLGRFCNWQTIDGAADGTSTMEENVRVPQRSWFCGGMKIQRRQARFAGLYAVGGKGGLAPARRA
jgi:hypothetical protein